MTISVYATHGGSGLDVNPFWSGVVGNYCVFVFPMVSPESPDECVVTDVSHAGIDLVQLTPGTPVYFPGGGYWGAVAIWGGKVTGGDSDQMHYSDPGDVDNGFLVFELQSDVDGIWETDGTNWGASQNDPPTNFPPLTPDVANAFYIAGSLGFGTGIGTQTPTGDPDDDGFLFYIDINVGGGLSGQYFCFATGPVSSPDTASPSWTWTDDLWPAMGSCLIAFHQAAPTMQQVMVV